MKEPKEISRDEMKQMLDARPGLSIASRQLILAGQCVFGDADGNSWKCPYDPKTAIEGPSHFVRGYAAITPSNTKAN
jgi:hypothetical protein